MDILLLSTTIVPLSGIIGVMIFGLVCLIILFTIMLALFYKKIPQGIALVRSGFGGVDIAFDKGMYVLPILHQVEQMDITTKRIEFERSGEQGFLCKDDAQIDLKASFFLRVNKSKESIMEVAQSFGCERTFNNSEIHDFFEAKFLEALKTTVYKFKSTELHKFRAELRDSTLIEIGRDLNGFTLEDCALDF